MTLILYFCVFAGTLMLSGAQQAYNKSRFAFVAGAGAAMLAAPIFLGLAVLAVLLFQYALIGIGFVLFAISKWKLFLILKLKAILVSIAGVLLTPFTLGLIWVLVGLIFAAMLYTAARDWTVGVYHWTSEALVKAAVKTRAVGDFFRRILWWPGWLIAVAIEAVVVLSVPLWGMWELFNWADGSKSNAWQMIADIYSSGGIDGLTVEQLTKLALLGVYGLIVYAMFLRGTGENARSVASLDMPDVV